MRVKGWTCRWRCGQIDSGQKDIKNPYLKYHLICVFILIINGIIIFIILQSVFSFNS